MITSPQEYNSLLHSLTNPNEFMQYIQIPEEEKIYKIDLNSRTAEAPDFLAVTDEHNAEIVWFSVDRFFDSYDLYKTSCWIQYTNVDKESFYFSAPMVVRGEKYGTDTILIPWLISKEVTKTSGTIQFSFQFFALSEDGLRFTFVLNTTPSKSKVLQGLVQSENSASDSINEFAADKLASLEDAIRILSGEYNLFWTDVN